MKTIQNSQEINKSEYKIIWLNPQQLNPADYNPRFITDESLEGLKTSIKTFGILDPIVLNTRTNNIVSGHQRWQAAKELNISKIPVIEIDIDEETEIKLNLTLNNPHIQGQFVPDKVSKLLSQIESSQYFAELELAKLQDDFDVSVDDIEAKVPDSFNEVEESDIQLTHTCPKCGFEFTPSN